MSEKLKIPLVIQKTPSNLNNFKKKYEVNM